MLFSLATIAFYLLTEHRAHLLAYSSYILFFGYILLHFFMCGGHGKHGGHGEQKEDIADMITERHKHGEAEKKDQNTQNAGGYEEVDQHEHSPEKSK